MSIDYSSFNNSLNNYDSLRASFTNTVVCETTEVNERQMISDKLKRINHRFGSALKKRKQKIDKIEQNSIDNIAQKPPAKLLGKTISKIDYNSKYDHLIIDHAVKMRNIQLFLATLVAVVAVGLAALTIASIAVPIFLLVTAPLSPLMGVALTTSLTFLPLVGSFLTLQTTAGVVCLIIKGIGTALRAKNNKDITIQTWEQLNINDQQLVSENRQTLINLSNSNKLYQENIEPYLENKAKFDEAYNSIFERIKELNGRKDNVTLDELSDSTIENALKSLEEANNEAIKDESRYCSQKNKPIDTLIEQSERMKELLTKLSAPKKD